MLLRDWVDEAKAKYPPNIPIPSIICVYHQFRPNYSKREILKYFYSRFIIIKKIQEKVPQNNNDDMEYTNVNAKNVRRVVVNKFNKNKTIYILFNDKCIVKIGSPGVPLELIPKAKAL